MDTRYALEHKAGSGFQGSVFKARDTTLDRAVALKKITRGADAVAHARAISRLPRHSSLVVVHDVVELAFRDCGNTEQYVVMEWLPGKTIKERLPWKMNTRVTKGILKQVTEAVNHYIYRVLYMVIFTRETSWLTTKKRQFSTSTPIA